jgi:hypothetical protein
MNLGPDKALETLNDDPVLSFEYYAMRTHNTLDGERALMFAVLIDALDTYARTRNATGHRKRVEFNEVNSWIRSRSTSSPFAFETICDSLGFNPDAIRFSLKSSRFNERNIIRHFRHVASNSGLNSVSAS